MPLIRPEFGISILLNRAHDMPLVMGICERRSWYWNYGKDDRRRHTRTKVAGDDPPA